MGHRSPHLSRPACFNTARACGPFLFRQFAPLAATAAVSPPRPAVSPPRPASPPARLPLPLSASKPATARQRAAARPPAAAARRPHPLASPPRPPDARPLPFPYPASAEARHAPPWGADAAPPPAGRPAAPPDAASRGRSPPPGCAPPAAPARTPPGRRQPPPGTLTAPRRGKVTARCICGTICYIESWVMLSGFMVNGCSRDNLSQSISRDRARAPEKMAEVPPRPEKSLGF